MKPLWDVIVVGAGPGGCVLSTMLARCGRRVLLLDKDVPPRYHVGESLSLVACNLLDAIGAGGKVRAAGFVPKSGATFIWGPDPGPWSVYYGEPEGPPAAMQVRRDELDQILVRHAASSGVEVRQGCRVQEALFEAGRAVGVRYLGGDGEQQCAYAPWTVDASGQDALLARQLGLLEPHPRLRSTVVWSYWAGGGRLPGRDAGNALFIGQRDVCFWYVPLDDRTGLAGVGAVVLPSGPRLLDGGPERPERFYRDALSASAPLSRLLSGARQTEPVRSAPATAYRCSRLAGPGWVLTGDAACFVDPILTPGVELAASHGMLAACTLNTVLDAPALEAQALALYGHLYAQRYETFVQLCLNLYEKAEAGPQARAPEPSGNGQARPPAGGRARWSPGCREPSSRRFSAGTSRSAGRPRTAVARAWPWARRRGSPSSRGGSTSGSSGTAGPAGSARSSPGARSCGRPRRSRSPTSCSCHLTTRPATRPRGRASWCGAER